METKNKPKLEGTRWDKSFEEPIRERWKKEGVFAFNESSGKPVFSIDTPPPYVNTPVHIGHAVTYTIMDMIARYKRMRGFEVLFPIGLDRNGLPIEVAAEKTYKVSMASVDREEFINMCKKLLEESSMESLEIFYKLGHSYNSWQPGNKLGDLYYTDSEEYRKLTQETFIDLWKMGLIYEDKKVNNYCPACRTTIADSEIEYKEGKTKFYYIKFLVKETGKEIIIATTRPELLCSCGMVIFNPEDSRYRELEGKTAVVPLYKKEIPIRSHPYAKPEHGTGLVMMCSFGDYTDIRFFREMKIKPVISIDDKGRMNENAGFLKGLTTQEARKKIVDELEKCGLIEKVEEIIHRFPVCERSKTPIEFIELPEFYLKQTEFKEKIKEIADKINFFSPSSKQILLDWIDSVSIDWPVSRRRYYATEIPLWYCRKCNEVVVPPKGRYYTPWKESSPVTCRCGNSNLEPETRVFDTWFDSSVSALYILKYGSKFFDRAFPCSLRPQGKEIVRTWLYYTLLRIYQLTKMPAFKNVWIHFHVLDDKGFKMSKSLGNVINPKDVLEKFGAEPFRAWCALEGDISKDDIRCSFERIEGAVRFLTKMWNIARFISRFELPEEYRLAYTDKWILNELDSLIKYCTERYDKFDFHSPAARIKHFLWEIFASHYMEMVKVRAYNEGGLFEEIEKNGAVWTLYKVLETVLLLAHPIVCFITTRIYKDVFGKDIEKESFPRPMGIESVIPSREITDFNSMIWKKKKERGLSLKSKVERAVIPEKLKPFEKDIKACHNIKNIEYGKETNLFF